MLGVEAQRVSDDGRRCLKDELTQRGDPSGLDIAVGRVPVIEKSPGTPGGTRNVGVIEVDLSEMADLLDAGAMVELYRYAIGEPYTPGRTQWPEGADLSLGAHGAELRLFFEDPTEDEVRAVRTGKARYAWIEGEHAAMLCYRFSLPNGQGVPWSDQPYHAMRELSERRIPDAATGPMPAQILLIDAATGILRAIRSQSWPARAADTIRATARRHTEQGYSPWAESAFIDVLHSRYPQGAKGTAEMVRQRGDVTWTGGDPDAAAGGGELSSAPPATPSGRAGDAAAGEPNAVIARLLGPYLVAGRQYPGELEPELARWYCYIIDGGHSIVTALPCAYEPHADPSTFLVPAPVRALRRVGWSTREGYVFADLPYDSTSGLRTEPDDDEF